MGGVLTGFATIGAIIVVGLLAAQWKILDEQAQVVLSRAVYYIATPALMITVLGDADVSRVLSMNAIATFGSVLVVAPIAFLLLRKAWRRGSGDTVIGTFTACYVNTGNLGLPIAAYALGDAALVAPMMLTQLLVVQPLGLALLKGVTDPSAPTRSRRQAVLGVLKGPLTNPLAIGSLIGVVLSVTGFDLPVAVRAPLSLVGGMSVPASLLAYGIALRLGPRPGAGEPPVQVGTLVALKLIVQPAVAFLIGAYVVGLDAHNLLAVTVIAALPTAQNVFTFAVQFQRGVMLARDVVFVGTVLSVPAILTITWLLT